MMNMRLLTSWRNSSMRLQETSEPAPAACQGRVCNAHRHFQSPLLLGRSEPARLAGFRPAPIPFLAARGFSFTR